MFGNSPSSSGGGGNNRRFPRSNNQFPQVDHQSVVDMVDQNSVAIQYWKAIQCPCITEQTGQPKVNCPSCRGLGWAYSAHEKGTMFQRAMVHSRRSNKLNEQGGWLTQGYSSMTFLPGVIPGDGDLVQVCKDREVVNQEYHISGAKLLDGSTAETLRFRDVCCVEKVVVIDATTKRVQDVPEDKWEFDPAQRRIVFHTTLPDGAQYSVRYLAVPEYILRADTAKPLLRVTHDDGLSDPARTRKDVVYPFNVQATRLDRAILARLRGQMDVTTQSTFNNSKGKGPFL